MPVHRTHPTHSFMVVDNEVLQDSRLSFPARGILVYLMALPRGTRVDVRTLIDQAGPQARHRVPEFLDELVECGYYTPENVRDEDGRGVRDPLDTQIGPEHIRIPPARPAIPPRIDANGTDN